MGHVYLRIHICDDCLLWGAEQGIILEAHAVRKPEEVTYTKWNPNSGSHD